MPPRPRTPHGDGDPPHDGGSPARHRGAGGGDHGSVAAGQRAAGAAFRRGRPTAVGGTGPPPSTPPASAPTLTPDDIVLMRWENNYDNLSEAAPRFNIAANDAAHPDAHTSDHHGPQLPLHLIPDVKTIEGRIYGGAEWPGQPKNGSFKWDNFAVMHRTINDYVSEHWPEIRSDLAIDGNHRAVFDAGHRVGEGFVNKGMGGLGPREAQYSVTSVVRIIIEVAPGDPPVPFIVTAFPSALG